MNACWKQASWEKQVKEMIPMASVSRALKMGQAFACYVMKGLEDSIAFVVSSMQSERTVQ